MRVLYSAMIVFLFSFDVNAQSNITCVYPDTEEYAKKIARFENDYGWEDDCNAKFIGMEYVLNGVNQADLNTLTAKANLVLSQGQKPISTKTYLNGLIFLYEFFQGKGIERLAKIQALQIVNLFFGAANQYGRLAVNTPPSWYTDPGCYKKEGSIANVLRTNTLASMTNAFTELALLTIRDFPPHCDGMNSTYPVAFQKMVDFLDRRYEFCTEIVNK